MPCLALFARQTRTRKRFDNGVISTFDGGDGIAALEPPPKVYIGAAPRAEGPRAAAAGTCQRGRGRATGRAGKAAARRAIIHAGP